MLRRILAQSHYTTDGSTPSCSSFVSTSNTLSLTVTSGETVKAFAAQAGLRESTVGSATYTIGTSQVTLSSSNVVFTNRLPSSSSVTLTNPGTAPLTISGILNSTTEFTQTNTCGTSLGAGSNCTVTVSFAPSSAGIRLATLAITDNASGSPHVVTLGGTSPLALGNQSIGGSTSQQISVNNSQSAAVSIGSVSITPNSPAEFSQTNNCGSSVASGGTCAITVTFAPNGTGARSATLSLTAGGTPYTLALTGTGASGGTLVSPVSLSFGSQVAGTASSPLGTTLTNNTGANIAVSGVSATGAFSISGNTCGSTVASGAACTVSVTFSPALACSCTGTLSISGSWGTSTVALAGAGIAPQVTITPSSLSFGTQNLNQTSPPQTITVTIVSTSPGLNLLVGSAPYSSDPQEFVPTTNCVGVVLAPGASCIIQVTFTPNITGSHNATLTIPDNGGGHSLTLSGSGQTQLAPPTFSIANGTQVVTNTQVTITAPQGSIIYTTDGSNPLNSSTGHTVVSPFAYTITNTVQLAAIARQAGVADSAVVWSLYTTGGVLLAPTSATLPSDQFTTFVMSVTTTDNWASSNDYVHFWVGSAPPWTNLCHIYYFPTSSTVVLHSDDDLSMFPGTIHSNTILSNSQCTLNLASSSASVLNSVLTVSLPISFSAGYAGDRPVWLGPVNQGAQTVYYEGNDTIQVNSITVTPKAVSLYSAQNQAFSANSAVNWSVSPQTGTISSGGQYASPVPVASPPQVVLVTATSQADPTKFATAAVTLVAGAPYDLYLSNLTILSGSPTYRASHAVTADTNVVVGGTAAVTFSAGTSITLGPGFKATGAGAGTTFHAVIQ